MWANLGWPLLAQAARMSDSLGSYGRAAVTLAVLILPWVIGVWLAKFLRTPDYGRRLGVILFALIVGLAVNVLKWPPRYGVDLSGGVNLIYEVDDSQRSAEDGPVPMDQLIAAVTKRVNPGGLKEVVVRPYGERQVEIIIPKVESDEAERIKEHISRSGSLEFRILASNSTDRDLVGGAMATPGREVRLGDEVVARWVPLGANEEAQELASSSESIVRDSTRGGKPIKEILVLVDRHNVSGQYLSRATVGPDNDTGNFAVDFQFNSTGAQLFSQLTSENLPDRATNRSKNLAVILDGEIFTAPSIRTVISDRGQITSPSYIDRAPVQALVDVLNAGSLPAALKKDPVSQRTTGPLLGEDSIEKGKLSIVVSTAAVLVFMLVYYRFAGLIACAALVMNVLLTVGAMTMFNAAFTLPGLAGLVLTVGMAVDANVLIYERMREEQARGATMKMAIRNGFDRAFSAIFDSNVTTLITAVILFFIGTDQVKGFATTLFIGVAMSMFTAIFCARVAMEIAERKKWITKLHLTQLIGHTNFDFVAWMRPAMILSALLIGAGLVTVVSRGKGLLDIDFTGGVSVEAVFDEPVADGETPVRKAVSSELPEDVRKQVREMLVATQSTELKEEIQRELVGSQPAVDAVTPEIQKQIDATFEQRLDELTTLPDVAVSSVQITGEPEYKRFLIDTSNPNIEAVEAILSLLFKDMKLARNSVEIGEVAMITPSAAPAVTPPPVITAPVTSTTPPAPPTEASTDTSSDATPGGACGVVYQDAQPETGGATEATTSPPVATETPASDVTAPAVTEAAPAPTTSAPVPPTTETPSPAQISPLATPAPAGSRFDGGTRTTLKFSQRLSQANLEKRFREAAEALGVGDVPFEATNAEQDAGATQAFKEWNVRVALAPEQASAVFAKLKVELESEPYFPSSSAIGGQVAANTQWSAIYALLASIVAIAIYLWVRFQRLVYGVAAVIALIHDVLVALVALGASYYLADSLAFLGVQQFKINLPIIAAFLTIIGFSINDTIVIFDRMREVKGKSPKLTADMINLSLNQTLSRTILTSLTVFITVMIMYALGGQGIHGFAFCMLVGVLSGTYSTVFIAAPLVLWIGAAQDVDSGRVKQETAVAASTRR
ncbi:MAG: protein translocase subunit SecD [Planctomycetia bacterium]|nr:protein translocase subunit SecD [Planctomycetia bacterium]